MFRAFLNYSVGRVHCCISEEMSGNENSWELVLLWKGEETAKMRTTLQGPWGSSWVWLGSITYLCLNSWTFYLTFSPWPAEVKEWESSLVGTCQPDKVNPPQEWRRSCLTLRHFCPPSACAQHTEGVAAAARLSGATLSAELVLYQSQAGKKNPATLHLLILWQTLVRLSIVSDYFCKVRQIQDGLWDGNYGPWSRGLTYPCSGDQEKHAEVCNWDFFSTPCPSSTTDLPWISSALPASIYSPPLCLFRSKNLRERTPFYIKWAPTRKPLCRKQNGNGGATQK